MVNKFNNGNKLRGSMIMPTQSRNSINMMSFNNKHNETISKVDNGKPKKLDDDLRNTETNTVNEPI